MWQHSSAATIEGAVFNQVNTILMQVLIIIVYAHRCFFTVLPILMNNFTRLYQCLPQDYVKTVNIMKQQLPGVPPDYEHQLMRLPTIEIINKSILSSIIGAILKDEGVIPFCDIMVLLCSDDASRRFINCLRSGK